MAKSKGFDIKALLLNHGEKFGAAMIGLLALTGLATANWSSCPRLEAELKDIATKTKTTWSAPTNAWPEDKKVVFESTPDVERMAQRMASPNEDIEQFATVRHWNAPINRVREKLAPVVVLAPESPESTLVEFTLVAKNDEVAEDEDVTATDPKAEEKKPAGQDDLEALFGKTSGANAAGVGAFPGGDPGGAGYAPGMDPTMLSGIGGMPESAMTPPPMELGLEGYGGGDMYMMGMGMGMGAAPVEKKVRSCAGVSVRCVFDLYRQTNMLAEALRMKPEEVTPRHIDFVNLQIQRKSAQQGTDPWAGEWENVSLSDIGEILEEAAYLELDIVNPSVVRSEITMPLPSRGMGKWTPANASHAKLEKFELSEEEKVLIDKHQAKLLEEASKLKAMLPPEQAKSEGFRRYALGSQDLSMALGGNYMAVSENMYSEMQAPQAAGGETAASAQLVGKNARFKTQEELEKFLNNTLVANRLLLVRFMDFTCDRGNSYQYRVRLEMRNPNFNKPIDELEQPELATQRTIFSEWSEPTKPVYVPNAYRYYTQKVESRPRVDEQAHLSMFYQHETAGTPVMTNLRVPVGVRIGGRQTMEVVDLGKSKLESQEVDLKSSDFLAAVSESPRVAVSEFPELRELIKNVPGGRVVPDRITVVNSDGAIVSRFVGDSVQSGAKPVSEKSSSEIVQFLLTTYDYLRPQAAGADPTSPYAAETMGAPGMMPPGMGMGEDYMGASGRGSSLGSRSRSKGRKAKTGGPAGYP
jgi:hypothetical protein